MAAQHPIFDDIRRGDLEAVKQHVLANPTMLEEIDRYRFGFGQMTPLCAIDYRIPDEIAHWLIDHRGQHDLNTRRHRQMTALHWSCHEGLLSIAQVLVASGGDPAVTNSELMTPLMEASRQGRYDVVAFLLRLPAVQATLDTVDRYESTALFYASRWSRNSCVQLLLDAGADPTIPLANEWSPHGVRRFFSFIAGRLRHAIAREPNRARTLHKARALLDAAHVIRKTKQDARDDGDSPAAQQQKAIAAAPVYLKARVQRDEALPRVELTAHQGDDERLRATVAFVVGREEGGVEYAGLPREL